MEMEEADSMSMHELDFMCVKYAKYVKIARLALAMV
jgi:hypothetical protein